MIRVDVTGTQEAVNYFKTVTSSLPFGCLLGIFESGVFVKNRIMEVTGDTEYARQLEVSTDATNMVTYVAPSPEYIRDVEARKKVTFTWRAFRCPYWKYIAREKLSGVAFEPELENIVVQSLEEIKEIIVNKLKEVFR